MLLESKFGSKPWANSTHEKHCVYSVDHLAVGVDTARVASSRTINEVTACSYS